MKNCICSHENLVWLYSLCNLNIYICDVFDYGYVCNELIISF